MAEDALSRALRAAGDFPLCDAQGADALEALATRFPQLFIAPVAEPPDSVDEAYRAASGRGIVPQGATLAHFDSSPSDELCTVGTPAGPVQVLYLAHRLAFETFLQCVGHKGHAIEIPRTIGAMTYLGLNDWGKVRAARAAYEQAGGQQWAFDRAALAKRRAFKSELVVISHGPYSNIPASLTPYDADQWTLVSRKIRRYHECAHVVCRRLLPDDINPLWDEITADAVGLVKAIGCYDVRLASLFLGVGPQGYTGGRLEAYLSGEQQKDIDAWAVKAYDAIKALAKCAESSEAPDAFAFLLEAKSHPLI